MLLSGVEGEIADFGGRSGELRLRPVVSDDRKSIQVDLSYRRPSDAGSAISTTQIIPVGSVLAVSIAETVYEGRSENKTPILGDLPYLNRYFRSIGIGREPDCLRVDTHASACDGATGQDAGDRLARGSLRRI